MKKVCTLYAYSQSKKLAFTALFSALCCIGTVVIAIPLPNGYFNVGDVFVLLSGWILGPLYGSVAAAVGSALADVLSGYAIYAPATAVIKSGSAFITYMLCLFFRKLVKKDALDVFCRLFSALFAEAFMALGYLLFETCLYGWGGALPALTGNLLQGGCCLAIATAIFSALYVSHATKKFLLNLHSHKDI